MPEITSLDLLFIDDSLDDLNLVLIELKKGGFDVKYERVDNEEGTKAALRKKDWDLILVDFSMPGFSGIAALSILKEMKLDIPAIVVSGTVGEEMAVDSMLAGARDYILKDRLVRLLPAIRRELQEARNRRAKRATEIEFLQLQKMNVIGRLAGGIAHDFNSVLAAIAMCCDLANDEINDPNSLRTTVTEIKKMVERGSSLTKQLLLFSRKKTVQPSRVELNDVIRNMEKMLTRLMSVKVQLETTLAPESWAISADPMQIEQVILNLAVNACDAMPDGGRLLIETSNVQINADDIETSFGITPASYVRLDVTDTGHGMDERTMARIFEPFFTTKPVGRGTGLGMPTAYGIVKAANGAIRVQSAIGKGTKFSIYLPRISGPDEPLSRHSQDKVFSATNTNTILLVEDEPRLRNLFTRALMSQGYQVISVAEAEEAIEVFNKYRDVIQLLLTDINMPGMDGVTLAAKLTTLKPEIKIAYMSGYVDEHFRKFEGHDTHSFHLIEKPFSTEELCDAVEKALNCPTNRIFP